MANVTDEHRAMAAALGIDLSKVDWAKLIAKGLSVLQFLQALLAGQIVRPPVAAACTPEENTRAACTQAASLSLQSALCSLTCAGACCGD